MSDTPFFEKTGDLLHEPVDFILEDGISKILEVAEIAEGINDWLEEAVIKISSTVNGDKTFLDVVDTL